MFFFVTHNRESADPSCSVRNARSESCRFGEARRDRYSLLCVPEEVLLNRIRLASDVLFLRDNRDSGPLLFAPEFSVRL